MSCRKVCEGFINDKLGLEVHWLDAVEKECNLQYAYYVPDTLINDYISYLIINNSAKQESQFLILRMETGGSE